MTCRQVNFIDDQWTDPQRPCKKSAITLSGCISASKKDCISAAENLTTLWNYQQNYFSPSKNLLSELKKVDQQIEPNMMAVKYSPKIWSLRCNVIDGQAADIDYIGQALPNKEIQL